MIFFLGGIPNRPNIRLPGSWLRWPRWATCLSDGSVWIWAAKCLGFGRTRDLVVVHQGWWGSDQHWFEYIDLWCSYLTSYYQTCMELHTHNIKTVYILCIYMVPCPMFQPRHGMGPQVASPSPLFASYFWSQASYLLGLCSISNYRPHIHTYLPNYLPAYIHT